MGVDSYRSADSRCSSALTLRGVGLAFENFRVTAQKIRSILYRLLKGGHGERKLRHLRDDRFVAGDDGGFKFVPERRKIGLRKSTLIQQQKTK